MPQVWITSVVYDVSDRERVAASAAIYAEPDEVGAKLGTYISRCGWRLISASEPVEVLKLRSRGALRPEIAELSRSVHRGRPVTIRHLPSATDTGSPGHQSRINHEPGEIVPIAPFLIVFNAGEYYEEYKLIAEGDTQFINIMSFSGAKFPCTIGVPFEMWDERAQEFHARAGSGYIISGADQFLVDISDRPLAEMLAGIHLTLNNPFDPLLVERSASAAHESRVGDPVILTFDGGRVYCAGRAFFNFTLLQYPKDVKAIQEDVNLNRVVDLVCVNALAELFMEGGWMLKEAPDFIRVCAGVVKASNFDDFQEFSSHIKDNFKKLVLSHICSSCNFVIYDHILRIARGLAISHEIENVPFALERWSQLLGAKELNISERVRQFEMEMTSFQVRKG